MTETPRLGVAIVTYNRADLALACLHTIDTAKTVAGAAVDVVVVDNGSDDGSVDEIERGRPSTRTVGLTQNGPLPTAMNTAWQSVAGEWVLLMNNDIEVDPAALDEILRATAAADPDVGAYSVQMRFARAPDRINSAGIMVDRLGVPFDRLIGAPVSADASAPIEVFGTCGGAGVYRRRMLEDTGGFDVSLHFGFEDVDLAWRAQMRGWRALHLPSAVVLHRHGGTVGLQSPYRLYQGGLNRVRMLAKHAPASQLWRYGPVMVAYDLAYVAHTAVTTRSLAPLHGRIRGINEWARYRRVGAADRRSVALAPVQGVRGALHRRRGWSAGASGVTSGR